MKVKVQVHFMQQPHLLTDKQGLQLQILLDIKVKKLYLRISSNEQ